RYSKKEAVFDPFVGSALPEIRIDETWSELLGLFVGDGACTRVAMTISVDGQDSDVTERVVGLLHALGLHATVATKPDRPRCVAVQTACVRLLEFLEHLGVAGPLTQGRGSRPRHPKVPEVIWRSPKTLVAAFL